MQLYVSGMEYPPPPSSPLSSSRLDFYSTYFARRQWYGLPCYVEKEKVSKMGKGGARTGKGRFEGSGETDTSFEESGKGTCIFIISSLFDSWSRGSILWILIFSFIFFFSSCMSWRSLSIFFFYWYAWWITLWFVVSLLHFTRVLDSNYQLSHNSSVRSVDNTENVASVKKMIFVKRDYIYILYMHYGASYWSNI